MKIADILFFFLPPTKTIVTPGAQSWVRCSKKKYVLHSTCSTWTDFKAQKWSLKQKVWISVFDSRWNRRLCCRDFNTNGVIFLNPLAKINSRKVFTQQLGVAEILKVLLFKRKLTLAHQPCRKRAVAIWSSFPYFHTRLFRVWLFESR